MRLLAALAAIVFTFSATISNGSVTVVEHKTRGWISQEFGANERNFDTNILVGYYPVYEGDVRNFFSFDLSSLTEHVIAAEFLVRTAQYVSPDATETFELHQVTAAPGTIGQDYHVFSASDYADLADGPSYGSYAFSLAEQNLIVAVPLTAAAVADINAAAGGVFEMGGIITSLTRAPGVAEFLFGTSGTFNVTQLQLTTVIVPEPSSWSMLLAASPIAWFAARRRAASVRH